MKAGVPMIAVRNEVESAKLANPPPGVKLSKRKSQTTLRTIPTM